jgi:hypothetical protein
MKKLEADTALEEQYLSPARIARILDVSVEFVYKHAGEYGGVKIGRKIVRFPKKTFERIMEEKERAGIQTQKEMDVRLLEERSEVPPRGISREARRPGSGGSGENYRESDKYGLREAVRRQTE